MKHRILIVDDNDLNVELLSQLLDEDYELETASNGEEALKAAASFRPDVVLMDLSMPVMDGWEATRRLRALPENSHLRILAVSACTIPGEVERAIALGCDGFVKKPVDEQALLDKIRAILEGRISAVPDVDNAGPNVTPQDHRRTQRKLDSWPVGVTSYRLGEVWLCHVDTDAGDIIGRARGATRDAAEKEAVSIASTKVHSSRSLRRALDDLRSSVSRMEESLKEGDGDE